MPLSPRVGGATSKPVDVSTSPASQRYASNTCTTTKMTYEFFNELIEMFTLAQVAYSVTNIPNDPNSLKKLLDAVRLGNYPFITSDISSAGTVNITIDSNDNNDGEFRIYQGSIATTKLILRVEEDGHLSLNNINGGETLTITDSNATTATLANPVMAFYYQNGIGTSLTRMGYVGFGSTANKDLYMLNDDGSVRLSGDSIILTGVCEAGTINADAITGSSFQSTGDLSLVLDSDNNNDNQFIIYKHSIATANRLLLIDENGNQVIYSRTGSDAITIVDEASSATLSNPYIRFGFSSAIGGSFTRQGVVGFGSTTDKSLYLQNDDGNVLIRAGDYCDVVIDTNNTNTTAFRVYKNSTANTNLIYTINENGYTQINSISGGDILSLVDAQAATRNDAISTMSFDFSNGIGTSLTRMGYVGFGSSSNDTLYVLNDTGAVRLSGSSIDCDAITAPSINFGATTLDQCVDGTYTVQVVNGSNGNSTIATRQIQAYTRIHKTVTISVVIDVQEMSGTDEVDSYVTMPFNFTHMAQGTWLGFDRTVITSYSALQAVFTAGSDDATNSGIIVGVAGSNRAYFRNPDGDRTSFNNVENQWLVISITYQAT